jgi:nucleoid-associated protein YgaU
VADALAVDDVLVLAATALGAVALARPAADGLGHLARTGTRRLAGAAEAQRLRGARSVVTAARRITVTLLGLTAPVLTMLAPARGAPARDLAPAHSVAVHPRPAVPAVYVVEPGDTLWGIARQHLRAGASDAQIARAWPLWYAANRRVIGADPGNIRPGMRLRVPDRRPTGTSSSQHHAPAVPSAAATSLDPDRR